MASLQRQNSLLTIEDIIRFLPDDSTIEDFSEEICLSLQESNKKVEQLKEEMARAVQTAEVIRGDIRETQSQLVDMAENRSCDISHLPVMRGQFYLFKDQTCYLASQLAKDV